MLMVPGLLLVTMYVAFERFSTHFGFPLGYLLAFGLYWLGWCLLLPAAVLGPRQIRQLFRADPGFRRLGGTTQALLWWPIVFPLAFAFLPRITVTSASVLVVSLALGIVTGITEEILWRGVYVTLFPRNRWLNSLYPSIAFGLWHLCPLAARPSRYPGGTISFVLYATALGLSYAYSARRTRSILWCTVSHCLHDALGLGGFAYAMWLR